MRMAHSQSYPVTVQVNMPQPHVSYTQKSSTGRFQGVWLPFFICGTIALVFLVGVNKFGGPRIFPQLTDPYEGLVRIIKQGDLHLYPPFHAWKNGIAIHYSSHLSLKNIENAISSLDEIFEAYPESHGDVYKNCWLEKPERNYPCFFDSSWVTDVCGRNDGYGYREKNGIYNPCFILKFEKTKEWAPVNEYSKSYVSSSGVLYDPGFIPVSCAAKVEDSIQNTLNLTVYPSKGFSVMFFPESQFDSKIYLAPLVAVKINGIRKGTNITLECFVATPNAFMLSNSGVVIIQITS